MLDVLGLNPLSPQWTDNRRESTDSRGVVDSLVSVALQQRRAARDRRDYDAADAVRDQLNRAGVVIEDTPSGPRWSLAEQSVSTDVITTQTLQALEALSMAGNSQRRNRRNEGTKKGAVVGSGGQRRRGLSGKGPTPPAEKRTGHPAARRANAAARKTAEQQSKPRVAPGRRGPGTKDSPELLVGRNPVVEALRAEIPAEALYVALGIDIDERITESIRTAGDRGLPIMEVSRHELDRMTGGVLHQGLALKVPPYRYASLDDVFNAIPAGDPGLVVAVDGVTDPRNLGAIVRSTVAFGSHGVVIPERRAAGISATAWRTSAGAAARVPVARVTNLVRSLKECQQRGLLVVGLDADADTNLDEFADAGEPLVIVVGSEGRGLSRLVGETCDARISIPMAGCFESLNASVAAAVTLAEVTRQRRSR